MIRHCAALVLVLALAAACAQPPAGQLVPFTELPKPAVIVTVVNQSSADVVVYVQRPPLRALLGFVATQATERLVVPEYFAADSFSVDVRIFGSSDSVLLASAPAAPGDTLVLIVHDDAPTRLKSTVPT